MSKKGLSWTTSEDELLTKTVRGLQESTGKAFNDAHKVNWTTVASKLKGRTAGGCQARWNVCLDPTVDRTEWTAELDRQLLSLMKSKEANSWSKRAAVLANGKVTTDGFPMRRLGSDCCERYFMLTKKQPESVSVLSTETTSLKRSKQVDAIGESRESSDHKEITATASVAEPRLKRGRKK